MSEFNSELVSFFLVQGVCRNRGDVRLDIYGVCQYLK